MNEAWERVKLSDFLTQVTDIVMINDDIRYSQVTVRMHNHGLVLRQECIGKDIKTKKQFRVRSGQFIFSRIDARNGAMGFVPAELNGAIVSNDFPVFEINVEKIDPLFFNYYTYTETFSADCLSHSKGTSNRQRLKEENFIQIEISLPSKSKQQHIVKKILSIQERMRTIAMLQQSTNAEIERAIRSIIQRVVADAERLPIKKVAPLIRRAVKVIPDCEYPELGIRSFGRGTFHKPSVKGGEINGKRLYKIEPGDLLFNNVFAWEGAVAVAQPEDKGRYGSHRFISRKPVEGVASADFLFYYFTTPEGIEQLGKASPGSAGRNRTLGLKMLDEIEVPLPRYEKQMWVVSIAKRLEDLRKRQAIISKVVEGLFRSVLDRSFRGEFE